MTSTLVLTEERAVISARELLAIRGWDLSRPPKGNLLWHNEYREYPFLAETLATASKKGKGAGYPDFIVVDRQRPDVPLIIGEAKADPRNINAALKEARGYANAFLNRGIDSVLAVGVAGSTEHELAVQVHKPKNGAWKPVEYRRSPIEWLPTSEETQRLLENPDIFSLDPEVPPVEVLESKAEEINRILRECRISDARRPATMAAFMLGLWKTDGNIRYNPKYVLTDINDGCRKAFEDAEKRELEEGIVLDVANEALANDAHRILRTLRLLNVTTLSGAHDYIGQLYEHFFRFVGGNTIGQFFTPRHVTRFMAELCEVSEGDVVVDPSCGTGGFLIAALYRMMRGRDLNHSQVSKLVKDRLWGFESEPITAGLCVANMILRGDGTSGIIKGDCFTDPRYPVGKAHIALGNPPFPHKKSDEQPEKFVDRALEALQMRGTAALVVPASMLVKSGAKEDWRRMVLRKHTLRAVIKLPDELFQPYATAYTNIAILEKGMPHKAGAEVFFARIENDGFRLKKNVRTAIPGGQLEDTLEGFHKHRDRAGWYSWRPISPDHDWSPGAYIESALADETDIRGEVDSMLRSDAALHAKHANRLEAVYKRIKSGVAESGDYRDVSNRTPVTLEDEPGLLGNYFDIFYGQRELHSKEWLEQGESIIVSSSGEFNGCYGFFDFGRLIKPPFATVPSTGTIGVSFVQRLPCGVTDDCLILLPKPNVSEDALYIAAAVVRQERWRFSYGRKITPARIARFKFPINDTLLGWIKRRREQTARIGKRIVATMADAEGVADEFHKLVSRWEWERPRGVDIADMILHPVYQAMINMGMAAVPLLLEELERKPSHWFSALSLITGANPVPRESEGKLKLMADAWIRWGKDEGYA